MTSKNRQLSHAEKVQEVTKKYEVQIYNITSQKKINYITIQFKITTAFILNAAYGENFLISKYN